jgi:diguanylate cyclase (GGDEF)-like protein
LRNVDGQVVGYNGISRDMSQRRAEELALRATHEQLQKQFDEIQLLQAKLAEQAIHDSLTGLYNRRYLDETLERELARARREGYPLSLVMIDLDLFKRINDDHGHKAGDEVLRALARLLREDVRAEDVPCRYGGEEFLVLLPKMPPATAVQRAEGWRRAIEGMTVPFGGEVLRITASFGVAAYPEHGVTPDDLTQRADEALYQAKAAGRNRVIALGGGQPPSGETP